MLEYFNISWRNIWRKKFRTILTAAVAFMAVFLSILMRSFHLGAWNNMIEAVVHSYSGYVQVHARDYWDEKSFDYSMPVNDSLISGIAGVKHVRSVIPRLESFALASAGAKTKGVIVTGIDPEKEDAMVGLRAKVKAGRYLEKTDSAVMISQRLAEFLGLQVGDSIVLMGQGYQGAGMAALYPVRGIIRLPSPEFDNKMVYMPLALAQECYSAQGMITSLVVDIDKPGNMQSVKESIIGITDTGTYEVMDWTEMMKELYDQFIVDNASGIVMLLILYMIVGFIAFGTMLMMTNERRREFAIMVAAGMQKTRLALMVGLELLYVMGIGLIAGVAGSFPILYYFHLHPIQLTGETAEVYAAYGMEPVLPVAWQSDYIINQGIIVFCIVIIAAMYPLWKVFRLNVTKSIRS